MLGVLTILGVTTLLIQASFDTVFLVGGLMAAAGLFIGVPAAFVYHLQLYRALKPKGVLAKRWYMKPYALHDQLDPASRLGVLSWFTGEVVGFLLIILGALIWAAGLFGITVIHPQ